MSRIHPVFNVIKLTPAPEDPIIGRRTVPPPLPEIIDGEEEWVVEEILDSRMMNRKLRYLVKWKDFAAEHNSWEPWDNVHAPDLVAEFYRKHPGAARHIRTMEFTSIPFRPTIVSGRHYSEGGVDVRGHSILPADPALPPSTSVHTPPPTTKFNSHSSYSPNANPFPTCFNSHSRRHRRLSGTPVSG